MAGKELTQNDAFEAALDSGLMCIEYLKDSPLSPFVEHIPMTVAAIDRAKITNKKKLREKTFEVYNALMNCAKFIDANQAVIAIRGQERMLRELGRHQPAKGRARALDRFTQGLEDYTPRNMRV